MSWEKIPYFSFCTCKVQHEYLQKMVLAFSHNRATLSSMGSVCIMEFDDIMMQQASMKLFGSETDLKDICIIKMNKCLNPSLLCNDWND